MFLLRMNYFAFIGNLAGPDLIVILLIVLVLFGAKKLPELARGLGQAVKEFQKGKDEFTEELYRTGNTNAPAERTAPPAIAAGAGTPGSAVSPPSRQDTPIDRA